MARVDAVAAKDTAKGMATVAVADTAMARSMAAGAADTATGTDTEVAAAVAARVTNARCDKN